jgi:hypothetical protein
MKNAPAIFVSILAMQIVSMVIGWQIQLKVEPTQPTSILYIVVGAVVVSGIIAAYMSLQAAQNRDTQVLIYDCEESDRYILAAAKRLTTIEEVEAWLRYVLKNYLSKPNDEAWILVSGTIMPLQYSDRDNLRSVTNAFWKSQHAAILADAPPKQKEKKKENRGDDKLPPPPVQLSQTAIDWQKYYIKAVTQGNAAESQKAKEVLEKHKIPVPQLRQPEWY